MLPSFFKTDLNNLVKILGLKPINNFSFLGDSLLIIFLLFLKKTDLLFKSLGEKIKAKILHSFSPSLMLSVLVFFLAPCFAPVILQGK